MVPTGAGERAIGPDVAEAVAEALKAVSDPIRLRVLSAIATAEAGEVSAGELAAMTDVTAPTVSHHLRVLKEVGLLTSERRASTVYYRIAPEVQHAVAVLLEVFAPVAARLGSQRAESPEPLGGRDPLAHADELIDRIGERLADRFAEFSPDLVMRTVRESYAALLRTARVTRYVPVLAERFAKQRLQDIRRIAGGAPAIASKPQVLFVCVANAGRSQLAAALLHRYAGDAVVIRSAGSSPAGDVHPTVRPLLEEILGPDAEPPFPKPLTDDAVRAADVVITMGCGDVCPVFPGKRYEDWALGDPALASPEGVRAIRDDIDRRVQALAAELLDPRIART
jgi:ArsR family transcriptional regulator